MSTDSKFLGIELTGEGGADGLHYPGWLWNMVAQITYNLICNGPSFRLDDQKAVIKWYDQFF